MKMLTRKINFQLDTILCFCFSCQTGFLGVSLEGHRRPGDIDDRYCGDLWPPELNSRDPRMILHFNTNGASRARFIAHYKFLSGMRV